MLWQWWPNTAQIWSVLLVECCVNNSLLNENIKSEISYYPKKNVSMLFCFFVDFLFLVSGKVNKAERNRRRNLRLSKILQPKNAVMILNELIKGCTYTVEELPVKVDQNQFRGVVVCDGQEFAGTGKSFYFLLFFYFYLRMFSSNLKTKMKCFNVNCQWPFFIVQFLCDSVFLIRNFIHLHANFCRSFLYLSVYPLFSTYPHGVSRAKSINDLLGVTPVENQCFNWVFLVVPFWSTGNKLGFNSAPESRCCSFLNQTIVLERTFLQNILVWISKLYTGYQWWNQ